MTAKDTKKSAGPAKSAKPAKAKSAKPAKSSAKPAQSAKSTKDKKLAQLTRGSGRKPPPKVDTNDRVAWLWAAYAAVEAEAAHAKTWDDPTVPHHVRALLMQFTDGPTAFGVWSANKMPPKPAWFTTWPKQLERLQQRVDAHRMSWSWVEQNCKEGQEFRVTCNLYHLEIVLDPTHPLYQSRGLPPRNGVERTKLRVLQKMLDRHGQLDPMHIRPERAGKAGLRLMINAGRQRKKALLQHNLDAIAAWWKPLDWMKMPRAQPPVLRLGVACIISRRPLGRALEEGAVLNTSPRRLSKLEMLEEALRLKQQGGLAILEIGEALGGIGRSSVHNLLTLERLHPTLLPLVWSEGMGLAIAYELVRLQPERQLALWAQIKGEPAQLAALKRLLTAAEAPESTPAAPERRPRMLSHQSLRAASEPLRSKPELAHYVDLVDALLAEDGARERLPAELQEFVTTVLGGAP